MATALTGFLPKRLAQTIADAIGGPERLADFSDKLLSKVAAAVKAWRVRPNGTEGYRTAEVTLGGVDTTELSSKTFESKSVPGLYFIGEVVDVTGHLGGFNFQWAWSSGHAAGRLCLEARKPQDPPNGHFLPTEKAILTDGFLFYANSRGVRLPAAQASRSGD